MYGAAEIHISRDTDFPFMLLALLLNREDIHNKQITIGWEDQGRCHKGNGRTYVNSERGKSTYWGRKKSMEFGLLRGQ